jgi:hypothetical protein
VTGPTEGTDEHNHKLNVIDVDLRQIESDVAATQIRLDGLDRTLKAHSRQLDALGDTLHEHTRRFGVMDKRFDGVDARLDVIDGKLDALIELLRPPGGL